MAALACAASVVPFAAMGQDKPNHAAGWVAVAELSQDLRIAEGRWATVVRFRPERLFVVDAPVVDAANGKVLIASGTRMIGMAGRADLACEYGRSAHDYFVGCVEDKDGDGRFETFFGLNHANPVLFSGFRPPRAKDRAVGPVSLTPAPADGASVGMVLFYRNRAELRGVSQFELCVLDTNNQNLWGDKTFGRGCLPTMSIGDGELPREVSAYGRTLKFLSRDAEGVRVSVTGVEADLPARL